MSYHVALIHKQRTSDFGVSFPDFWRRDCRRFLAPAARHEPAAVNRFGNRDWRPNQPASAARASRRRSRILEAS